MTDTTSIPARDAGTITIGGSITVNRLGFGAMRITGEGVWGDPPDPEAAKAVLRRAVELGINLIDTADAYGPDVSERLIGEALAPYADGVVIATKAGLTRSGPGRWDADGRPEHIRSACEGSLRRLQLDTIDLYQLHRIDPKVPLEESLGAMVELQEAGKVRHIGVSNFNVDELRRAQAVTAIASVQNRFNLVDRADDDVVDACTADGIAFIPWFPLATGDLAKGHDALSAATDRLGAAPSQVALAWLLARSPMVLPIPGTSSIEHLEENTFGAGLRLTEEEKAALDTAA